MQRYVALFIVVLITALTLVPAYYPPDDEALRQNTSLSDVYCQTFAATGTGTCSGMNHTPAWTGVSLSWVIAYRLPQYTPTASATRAPPLA